MKKALLLSLAFAVLLMTNCRKNNVQPLGGYEPTGETIDVALNAGTGDDKTVIDGLSVSWVVGDRIYVVGQLDGYLGYMTAQSSGNPVKFKGTIKKTTAAQNYYFYYVGDNDFTLTGDNEYTFSVANQYGLLSGDANSIANKLHLMKGSMYVGSTPGGELGAVTLYGMMSITRLNLQTNGTSMTSGTVTVSGSYSSVKINTKTGEYVSSSPLTSNNITLNNASGSYYMAVIPGNQTSGGTSQTLTFTANSSEQASLTATIATNKFYNKDSAKAVNMVTTTPPAALSGLFSVSSTSKVQFSRGNLYHDSEGWKLEANQYDYRTWSEGSCCINGTSGVTGANNCGLFFWVSNRNWQNTGYEPYAPSRLVEQVTAADVIFTNSGSGANPDFHLYGEESVANVWRTMGCAEWYKILNGGVEGVVRTNRYAKARLKGIAGLVLFPDGYNEGVEITPPAGMAAINTADVDYPTVSIADATWTSMESAGVVFLPAAGTRNGTVVNDVGTKGIYYGDMLCFVMSSNNGPFFLRFTPTEVTAPVGYASIGNSSYGHAIRLVRDVN